MRFVPVKSEDQQALLMLHRVRDQLIGQRTATINALRGHLAELGIVAPQRQAGLRQLLATLGELEDDRIPPLAREVLQTAGRASARGSRTRSPASTGAWSR